jgi:hypothetical protein
MSWARFDDDVLDHPKLLMVSDLAAHLWFKAIVWSRKQKTNGVVPRHVIATLLRVKKTDALAKELVDAIPPGKSAGLFESIDGGWKIHDFDHFGPPQREELSETRAEAGRRGAAKRWQTDGKPDGKREDGDGKLPSACHAVPMANDSSRAGAPAHPLPGAPAFPSRPVPSRPVLADASTQAAGEPANEHGPRPSFGKAPHGGKTLAEKQRDVDECASYLASRMATLGVQDERDLRGWLTETLPEFPIPADTPVLPLLRLAFAAVRDSAAATPGMRAESKLARLRAQVGLKAADDKADGWSFARSDGQAGKLAPKALERGGVGPGSGLDTASAVADMQVLERDQEHERAKRRGGEASATQLFSGVRGAA